MARIKIEDIQTIVEKSNWQLVSTEYKNLDSPLEFRCSAGHVVIAPWKKMRENLSCPICTDLKNKITTEKVLPKSKDTIRLLALDQATHITGFSIYDNEQLIHFGTYSTPEDDEIARDHNLKEWLINMVYNWKIDYIALEDIQLQQFGAGSVKDSDNVIGIQTFKILAHLQGILMETCYELNITYLVCPTPSWRAYCKVRGRSKTDKKASMQKNVLDWFGINVTNDEADAIGIGKYAISRIQSEYLITDWE